MPASLTMHCETYTEARINFVSQPQMLRRKPEAIVSDCCRLTYSA